MWSFLTIGVAKATIPIDKFQGKSEKYVLFLGGNDFIAYLCT
jgi:hypothetical protein